MGAAQPDRASTRGFVPAYLLAVAVAVGIEAATPAGPRLLVHAAMAFVPVLGIPIGVRVNRIRRPLPPYLLTAGLGVGAVNNVMWGIDHLWGPVPGAGLFVFVFDPVSFIGVLGAAILLVGRQAPGDAGRIIDAALIGVCGAGMLWEWVLRPNLGPDYRSPAGRISALIATLALMAILGSLLRVLKVTGRARPALTFLFVALALATVSRVVDQLGYSDRTVLLWTACYLSLAAAFLHPAGRYLTVATHEVPDPVTSGRLLRLGLILAVIPLVGGVPQLFGQPPDGPLLTVGTLVTIPLVLLRIGQLARQRTEAQDALAYQAAHDELTGLPNRRTVLEELDRAVGRFNAGELDQLTVLFCDLDGFKPVNDRLGHQAGDEVLRIAGARLRDCLRASDLIGRFGGDEFLIVCPHAGGDDIASRVERLFDEPLRISAGTVTLGVSVGVAVTQRGTATSADALVAAADDAMYAVKRARRAAAR